MSLQRQVSLALVLKEMRDKIRSSSAESEDEAGSDPKVDKPLSKGAVTAPRGRVADKRSSSRFRMTWATAGKFRRF